MFGMVNVVTFDSALKKLFQSAAINAHIYDIENVGHGVKRVPRNSTYVCLLWKKFTIHLFM